MRQLAELLLEVTRCDACGLMSENNRLNIRYVPILPKPKAKVIFIGRDPSPRTAAIVGVKGGRSVFIDEIFVMATKAKLDEHLFYISDLLKCHWRTSVGKPLPGTETRPPRLTEKKKKNKAEICMNKWLLREIELLKPKLIVGFGEELYQLMKESISIPRQVPKKLSATLDKSVLDAEMWIAEHGFMKMKAGCRSVPIAFLRHPGNSRFLKPRNRHDKRLQAHRKVTNLVVNRLREL